MTATLNDMNATKRLAASDESAEADAAKELVRLARERGLSLTGPDGLLKQLTKTVIETALNEEMTEHLAMRSTTRLGGSRAMSVTGTGPRRC